MTLLRTKELAKALKMAPRTIDYLRARGIISYLRPSPRLIRFELQKVLRDLSKYEVRAVGRRLP